MNSGVLISSGVMSLAGGGHTATPGWKMLFSTGKLAARG